LKMPGASRAQSDRSLACLAALLASAAITAANAAPDSGALIARLARQPPATTAFTEVRFSALLAEPLVVSGMLDYERDGVLNRRVETPYRETTTISGETVRVERDGDKPRTFALRRAPELRGLLTGMIGLLTGDGSFIGAQFKVSTAGDDESWRIELEPTDSRLRERLSAIRVVGAGDEPHCFVILDTQGGASVMLLGETASAPLPQPIVLAGLLGHCATG
ncbi:MAG TPA: LolA-related protein, partial [Gammaproteobacteria bacterium]|nr:LolA-related protein [Gammaproteobacteria bacterium]